MFIFLIIIGALIATVVTTAWVVPGLLRSKSGYVPDQSSSVSDRPSDFPQFVGKDGREVLMEMNAQYPQFRIEIVGPDSVGKLQNNYDDNRVRMYVTRTGRVSKLYIG